MFLPHTDFHVSDKNELNIKPLSLLNLMVSFSESSYFPETNMVQTLIWPKLINYSRSIWSRHLWHHLPPLSNTSCWLWARLGVLMVWKCHLRSAKSKKTIFLTFVLILKSNECQHWAEGVPGTGLTGWPLTPGGVLGEIGWVLPLNVRPLGSRPSQAW